LSACESERGTEGGYTDVDSFARIFGLAGVPHVVASRWNVDSATTMTLMQDFYAALSDGATVPESLRRAEGTTRSHMGSIHPYYWSAFRAFGRV